MSSNSDTSPKGLYLLLGAVSQKEIDNSKSTSIFKYENVELLSSKDVSEPFDSTVKLTPEDDCSI